MDKCIHYWVIQPARGPKSGGICQKCGEVREFENSLDDAESSSWQLTRDQFRNANDEIREAEA
jgi:hypothetical protein